MNPILLFCGIPQSLQAEIHSRCKEEIPGVYPIFLRTIDEVSRYLKMEEPHEGRHYPAPHFMILYSSGESFSIEQLKDIKLEQEFLKIPVILLTEGVEDHKLKEAFTWLYAGIVKAPSSKEDKLNFLIEMVQYWSGIIKLPLV